MGAEEPKDDCGALREDATMLKVTGNQGHE
jgi:hypothetical protein